MKKIIVANWKMNPKNLAEARGLIAAYEHVTRGVPGHVQVIVAAPFIYLPLLGRFARKVKLAAQNVSWAKEGALTGEISAHQLKQFGVSHVILGHSERRMYLAETDSVVNAKILAALKNKLTPIVCLGGESGAIKNEMKNLVTKQFIRVTKNLNKKDLEKIIYVYEPSWAISTMNNSHPETGSHAGEMIEHIRDLLKRHIGKKSESTPVLYGGTVNKNNAAEYAPYLSISGALVGAASLDSENFTQVVREFQS